MTDFHQKIANDVPQLKRGIVWCRKCDREQKVDGAACLASGWPKCCGQTMTIDVRPDDGTIKACVECDIMVTKEMREQTIGPSHRCEGWRKALWESPAAKWMDAQGYEEIEAFIRITREASRHQVLGELREQLDEYDDDDITKTDVIGLIKGLRLFPPFMDKPFEDKPMGV